MKVIFLDIDGVLNPWDNLMKDSIDADDYGISFETSCVESLRKITITFSDKIVISSTWRLNGLLIMKEMWKFRNLPGTVIDVTPNLDPEETSLIDNEELTRGLEVQDWLSRNDVDDYLIIDDCNQFLDDQQEHLLLTDGDVGLQESDYLKLKVNT